MGVSTIWIGKRGLPMQKILQKRQTFGVPAVCDSGHVKDLSFAKMVDSDAAHALEKIKKFVRYPAKSVLDPARTSQLVGVVVQGYLRMQHFTADGRRHIVCLMTPGDLVANTDVARENTTLETATEVVLCQFDLAQFDILMQKASDLARIVYLLRTTKLEQLNLLAWQLGVLTAEERICAFLVMLAKLTAPQKSAPDPYVLALEIPRSDIADLIGTTVETISRTLSRLARLGVIKIISPRQIHIFDKARLIEMGCLKTTIDQIQSPLSLSQPH